MARSSLQNAFSDGTVRKDPSTKILSKLWTLKLRSFSGFREERRWRSKSFNLQVETSLNLRRSHPSTVLRRSSKVCTLESKRSFLSEVPSKVPRRGLGGELERGSFKSGLKGKTWKGFIEGANFFLLFQAAPLPHKETIKYHPLSAVSPAVNKKQQKQLQSMHLGGEAKKSKQLLKECQVCTFFFV